jgi:Protein of unknown function (DUF5818)
MKATGHQLVFIPVVLIIGGALFAFGHSLRSEAGTVEEGAARSDMASTAGVSSSVVPATLASIAAIPAAAPAEEVAISPIEARTGIIVSMNGERYILRDDSQNTWYHLDDQKAAASFLGKKVTVIGPVDPATDVIHVQTIEEAKA